MGRYLKAPIGNIKYAVVMVVERKWFSCCICYSRKRPMKHLITQQSKGKSSLAIIVTAPFIEYDSVYIH